MRKSTSRSIAALLCPYLCGLAATATCRAEGLPFNATSELYDLGVAELNVWDAFSVDLSVRADTNCPAGAVIFDKLGPGTGQGIRLETSPRGTLRVISTAPKALESQVKLPTDRVVRVVVTCNPREKLVAMYVDGKLVAKLETDARERFTIIGSQEPLRLGSDQLGQHRFFGAISRLALYDRALTEDQVASLAGDAKADHQVGSWQLAEGVGRTIQPIAGKGLLVAVPDIRPADRGPGGALTLWYNRPAREWLESLAFGNGRLGGTVFGGVEQERIQLNEDTVWTGGPYDPANPGAPDAIKTARDLLFAGNQKDAESLIEKSAMGLPKTMAVYQTVGSLLLDFPQSSSPFTDYARSLDLDTAVATTTFKRDGVTYAREVFASHADQVVAVRLTADKPGSITVAGRFITPFRDAKIAAENNLLTVRGNGGAFNGTPGKIRFTSLAQIQNQGGTATAEGDAIRVRGADSVTMLVSCHTNYVNYHDLTANPDELAQRDLSTAGAKGYDELRARHVKDHHDLFRRLSLDLGTGPGSELPTDERIRRFDGKDPSLEALYFQFGRYLLISSSRPGGQPANLQGLWNDALGAAWGGKYTVNINTEENYWPAETTNLSECAEPLFQLVRDIAVTGQKTAATMYHAKGWVCHHNTDLWRATAPIDSAVGFWPMGGAWLTTHLWQHYLFTGDRQFLESAYPIFKGASQFFLDTLVEEPTHHWLVTCPSMSPEHGGLTAGPTMDMSILRDLFEQTAAAGEHLGVDADFRKQVLETRARLAPFQIGKYGQLQEWLRDLDAPKDTHRHLSHLYGLFPSAQITPESDPKVYEAARNSLFARGTIGPGWSLAWKENLWARAGDGDKAHALLVTQLTPPKSGSQGGGTFPNMFDAHPPFQIDGNFAATSAVAEMLLQSHRDFLDLLPALPKAWPKGSVHGLVARGGFVVDMRWDQSRLAEATLHSRLGQECRILSAAQLSITDRSGTPVRARREGSCLVFPTTADMTYLVHP